MKLISCYIENFGSIKKKAINFDKNVTSVCEDNGFGKTTLACFLEVMLYGMDTDRANSKELGTRRHYNPFGGGRYGGNIVFSAGADVYKIERFFDERSESKDVLTVYKNNELCPASPMPIGERLFGIDRQSFERTIFIDAREMEPGTTGSINAKLNTFIEGGTDDTNTESALSRLDKAANEYKKTRNDNGLISQESAKLIAISTQIDNLTDIKNTLPEKYGRLAEQEREIKKLQQTLDGLKNAELVLKDWEYYDALQKGAEESKKVLAALDEKYPLGIPSADELAAVKDALSAKDALKNQSDDLLSLKDAEALAELEAKYCSGVPSAETLAKANEKINRYASLSAKLAAEQSARATEREEKLRGKFKGGAPTDGELERLNGAVAEYKETEKLYADTPDYIIEQPAATNAKKQANGKKYIFIAVTFAIVAAAGAGVMFANVIAGAILLAAGVVCLTGTAFIYLFKRTSSPVAAEPIQRINPEKAVLERRKNNLELKIKQITTLYGYPPESGVDFLVESFKTDLSEYGRLLRTDAERRARIENLGENIAELEKELRAFFAGYGFVGGNFRDMLAGLQNDLVQYNTLANTRGKLREKNESAANKIAALSRVIDNFCSKYGFDPADIAETTGALDVDAARYRKESADYNSYRAKAESFRAEKNLTARPESFDPDEEDGLKRQLGKLNSDRSILIGEINDCESEAERLDNLIAEKESREETLRTYRSNYDLICKTRELLARADKQLKDRYVAPIKNNFIKYAELLETALGEKVTMTSGFEIRFERGGTDRSEKYLSAGQLSVCAFCFRMALIDNMYPDEKPFLILDDPFVSLDQTHFDRMKAVIKKLSGDFQIIYFTCHESRQL